MKASESSGSVHPAEAALRQAQLTSDVPTLERLIDDTLIFVGPDGLLYGKQDDLDAHRRGLIRLTQLDPSEERILDYGSIVVLNVRMQLRGSFHGTAFEGPFRYTRVWREFPDGWRIVAGHVSAIADAGAPATGPTAD